MLTPPTYLSIPSCTKPCREQKSMVTFCFYTAHTKHITEIGLRLCYHNISIDGITELKLFCLSSPIHCPVIKRLLINCHIEIWLLIFFTNTFQPITFRFTSIPSSIQSKQLLTYAQSFTLLNLIIKKKNIYIYIYICK
jgi:hypothetical protein